MAQPARRWSGAFLFGVAAVGAPGAARAQLSDTTLIPPTVPDGFDRGRNVGVLERSRPDYDPLGVRSGGFIVLPRIDAGIGATDNTYFSDTNKEGALIGYVNPSVVARSDWSRHQAILSGSAQVRRFLGESRRNEDAFAAAALGRLDFGSTLSLTGEAQAARQFETPFSGEQLTQFVALSRFTRGFLSMRGQYQAGRGRATLAVDHTGLEFSDIRLASGGKVSQADRDRDVERITGQYEFAFSPSLAAYGQVGLSYIDYDSRLRNGQPNRDSDGYRVIVGVNFDLAGVARGSVGGGYVRRNYKPGLYRDVSGFSAEARLELFPSELTTFTVAVRRVIEDSTVGTSNAFFDNRLSFRVDHELLQNMLLNATAELSRQDFIGPGETTNVYRASGGARYFVSRTLGLEGSVTYTGRDGAGALLGSGFDEFRGQIGITLRR